MRRPWTLGLIGLLTALGPLGATAPGVELRNSLGGRQVHRTASLERPAAASARLSPELADWPSGDASWTAGDACCNQSYSSPACGDAGCSESPGRLCGLWVDLEYLFWWRSGARLPTLVTTSPAGTPVAQAGLPPDAQVLFGGERVGDRLRPGGRLTVGTWLDGHGLRTINGRFFALGEQRAEFIGTSDDFAILARPFFDPQQEVALLVTHPDTATQAGQVHMDHRSRVLGADAFIEHLLVSCTDARIDFLTGYQFSRVDERLAMRSEQRVTGPGLGLPLDTRIEVVDDFGTRNQFHGGTLGLRARYFRDCLRLETLVKVGLGNMNQRLDIDGRTRIDVPSPGEDVELPEGLLAQPSNMGDFERDRFAVVPDVTVRAGWQLNQCVFVHAGYSLIFWSSVLQPGHQIDRRLDLDTAQPPPAIPWVRTSYLVQGLNLGVELDW